MYLCLGVILGFRDFGLPGFGFPDLTLGFTGFDLLLVLLQLGFVLGLSLDA